MVAVGTILKATVVAGRRQVRSAVQPCRKAAQVCQAAHLDFNTTAFKKDLVQFAETEEYIVKGGRDKFGGLPAAFEGVKEVIILPILWLYINILWNFGMRYCCGITSC